jgi:hypothetical protein
MLYVPSHEEQLHLLKQDNTKYISYIRAKCRQYQKQDSIKFRIPIRIIKEQNQSEIYTNNIQDISNISDFTNQVRELLKKSNMTCYYCLDYVFIEYNENTRMKQWTLDRKDNSNNHHVENCIISCLKCNLQRHTKDSGKFKFTKQFKLEKIVE